MSVPTADKSAGDIDVRERVVTLRQAIDTSAIRPVSESSGRSTFPKRNQAQMATDANKSIAVGTCYSRTRQTSSIEIAAVCTFNSMESACTCRLSEQTECDRFHLHFNAWVVSKNIAKRKESWLLLPLPLAFLVVAVHSANKTKTSARHSMR